MCLMIWRPKGRSLTEDHLRRCYDANPDGFGFMWKEDDYLSYMKCTGTVDEFIEEYRRHNGHDLAIHLRTATSGAIAKAKCHPFEIDSYSGFMANGNLWEFTDWGPRKWNDDLSDMERFNEHVLKKRPDLNLLYEYCRNHYTKMILWHQALDEPHILNFDMGVMKDGCWYSNGGIDDYIGYGFSGAYYYQPDDVRHKGGLETPMLLDPDHRDGWVQCDTCGGYFKMETSTCRSCQTYLRLMRNVR